MLDAGYYRKVYEWAYARDGKYGQKGHGLPHIGEVCSMLPDGGILLDVGCGKHQFSAAVLERRPDAVLFDLDIVRVGRAAVGVVEITAPAWDLSVAPGVVDVLTSFDVLEHLKEEDLPRTLSEWSRRSVKLAVTICHNRSAQSPEGNLHQTVKPKKWWTDLLSRYFDRVKHGEAERGTFATAKGRIDDTKADH